MKYYVVVNEDTAGYINLRVPYMLNVFHALFSSRFLSADPLVNSFPLYRADKVRKFVKADFEKFRISEDSIIEGEQSLW